MKEEEEEVKGSFFVPLPEISASFPLRARSSLTVCLIVELGDSYL